MPRCPAAAACLAPLCSALRPSPQVCCRLVPAVLCARGAPHRPLCHLPHAGVAVGGGEQGGSRGAARAAGAARGGGGRGGTAAARRRGRRCRGGGAAGGCAARGGSHAVGRRAGGVRDGAAHPSGAAFPSQLQEHAGGGTAGRGGAARGHARLHRHPHRRVQLPWLPHLLRRRHAHHPGQLRQPIAVCGRRHRQQHGHRGAAQPPGAGQHSRQPGRRQLLRRLQRAGPWLAHALCL